jgi:CHAT domain-containing protein
LTGGTDFGGDGPLTGGTDIGGDGPLTNDEDFDSFISVYLGQSFDQSGEPPPVVFFTPLLTVSTFESGPEYGAAGPADGGFGGFASFEASPGALVVSGDGPAASGYASESNAALSNAGPMLASDSFDSAMTFASGAGEINLSAPGLSVEVSLGSSFALGESPTDAAGPAAPMPTSGPGQSDASSAGSITSADKSGSAAVADGPQQSQAAGGDSTATAATSSGEKPSADTSVDAKGGSAEAGSDNGGAAAAANGSGTASGATPSGTTPGGQAVVEVPSQQAVAAAATADQSQAVSAVNALLPERSAGSLTSPSVPQMQQGLSNAAERVRLGGGVGSGDGGGLGPQSWLPREGGQHGGFEVLIAAADANPVRSDASSRPLLPPSFNRAAYMPAILHVRFTDAKGGSGNNDDDAFLDVTLVPLDGEPEGRRVEVSRKSFANDLRQLYRQLSRQESLQVSDARSPSRRLYDQIFAAIQPVLQKRRITTLLISADRGLQAVPFAALHDGQQYFGNTYAFSLTPSLALTSLEPPLNRSGRLLAAGAAVFDGLAPLPLVPTELNQLSVDARKDKALNKDFTPSTLMEQAADPRYTRVHVATHAEFLPGGPAASRLYSGTVPIPLSDFVKLRRARQGAPLDLISFSACRTALGDADSELGFAGLALQAGARSAVGTLWYVDDVATSAYFVQMYRYLDAGIPKAEALQLTRQAFSRGLVRLEDDRLVGPDGQLLIGGLTRSQQRRVEGGLGNPYYWAGIELLGAAW